MMITVLKQKNVHTSGHGPIHHCLLTWLPYGKLTWQVHQLNFSGFPRKDMVILSTITMIHIHNYYYSYRYGFLGFPGEFTGSHLIARQQERVQQRIAEVGVEDATAHRTDG